MVAKGCRKSRVGRDLVRFGLVALVLVTLGVGLWLTLGADQRKPAAEATNDPDFPSVTPSSAIAPISATGVNWQPVPLPAGAKAVRVPVLMYHYTGIVPQLPVGSWSRALTLSSARFKQEMDYLGANRYHPVTVAQIYAAAIGSTALPTRPIAITFDDGGEDNYATAFPILQQHHFVATFFVITGAVGKPGYMTWAQLRAMSRAGMAVESHTVDHADLPLLDDTKLRAELVQSRQAIQSHLALDVRFLAYPGGDADQRVMAAVEAAGYWAALTDKYGAAGDLLSPQARYDWPREGIGPAETLGLFERTFGVKGGGSHGGAGARRVAPRSGAG